MEFYHNYNIIIVTALCIVSAQLLKVINYVLSHRKINFVRIVETGGMPSSHSASSAALTTLVWLREGATSSVFALALFFTAFIMYEAAGVRRAAGRQAKLLNELVDDLYKHKPIKEQKLKELLGHTPLEVFMGALYGMAFAIAFYR